MKASYVSACGGIVALKVEIDIIDKLIPIPYVGMTLKLMERFGVTVEHSETWGRFFIRGAQKYIKHGKAYGEGDVSSVSYFLGVAAITGGTVTIKGYGTSSLQGDASLVKVLENIFLTVLWGQVAESIYDGPPKPGIDFEEGLEEHNVDHGGPHTIFMEWGEVDKESDLSYLKVGFSIAAEDLDVQGGLEIMLIISSCNKGVLQEQVIENEQSDRDQKMEMELITSSEGIVVAQDDLIARGDKLGFKEAREIHRHLVATEYASNLIGVVSMLAKYGRVSDVKRVEAEFQRNDGLRQYPVMLETTVLGHTTCVSQGGGNEEKAEVIQVLLVVDGLNTLLPMLFGTRLPVVMGGMITQYEPHILSTSVEKQGENVLIMEGIVEDPSSWGEKGNRVADEARAQEILLGGIGVTESIKEEIGEEEKSEILIAAQLCDRALDLVEAIRGVHVQTHVLSCQAWTEKLTPCWVLNKIDRLITKLEMDPMDAYYYSLRIVQEVNEMVSAYKSKKYLSNVVSNLTGPYDEVSDGTLNLIEEDEEDTVQPQEKNMAFVSALNRWGFTVGEIVEFYGSKLGTSTNELKKALWNPPYYISKIKLMEKRLGEVNKSDSLSISSCEIENNEPAADREDLDHASTTVMADATSKAEMQAKVGLLKELSEMDYVYVSGKLAQRIVNLSGAIFIIKVGSATEIELEDIKNDTLAAIKLHDREDHMHEVGERWSIFVGNRYESLSIVFSDLRTSLLEGGSIVRIPSEVGPAIKPSGLKFTSPTIETSAQGRERHRFETRRARLFREGGSIVYKDRKGQKRGPHKCYSVA